MALKFIQQEPMISNLTNNSKIQMDHDAWILQKDARVSVIQLHIEAGESMALHRNPDKVIFYVLEGSGSLFINDKELEVQKGDFIEVKANLERGWRNPGQGLLKLLVIKVLEKNIQ